MSDQLFHRRCFLNDETGAAIVEATLTNGEWRNSDGSRRFEVDGTLRITDCSRSIELSVSFNGFADGVEDARKSLRKLDRLIDAVQGLRDALARAAKREWPGKKF